MEEVTSKSEVKSEIAEHRERDAHGHFISEAPPLSEAKKIIEDIIPTQVTTAKTTDDNTLLDVHIGNPLRKITQLLEEIKKQKAFSFDIKGSLGIAGVIIVVAGFGVFGWVNTLVCSKGEQSFIGTIRELQITDAPPTSPVPLLDQTITWVQTISGTKPTATSAHRFVLITNAQTVLHLVLPKLTLPISPQLLVTGNYDTCSQTVTITDSKGIETYP